MQNVCTLKVHHNGELRRFTVDTAAYSLSSFHETISELFGARTRSYSIQYTDEDDDQVCIGTDSELKEAFCLARQFSNNVLKLEIIGNAGGNTQPQARGASFQKAGSTAATPVQQRKYFTMATVGLPIDVIRQKMLFDGVSEVSKERIIRTISMRSPPPPPPAVAAPPTQLWSIRSNDLRKAIGERKKQAEKGKTAGTVQTRSSAGSGGAIVRGTAAAVMPCLREQIGANASGAPADEVDLDGRIAALERQLSAHAHAMQGGLDRLGAQSDEHARRARRLDGEAAALRARLSAAEAACRRERDEHGARVDALRKEVDALWGVQYTARTQLLQLRWAHPQGQKREQGRERREQQQRMQLELTGGRGGAASTAPVQLPAAKPMKVLAGPEGAPWAEQLAVFASMGFYNQPQLIKLLVRERGNIQRVVNSYQGLFEPEE